MHEFRFFETLRTRGILNIFLFGLLALIWTGCGEGTPVRTLVSVCATGERRSDRTNRNFAVHCHGNVRSSANNSREFEGRVVVFGYDCRHSRPYHRTRNMREYSRARSDYRFFG